MFADDTSLFCSNKKIKPLFLKGNLKLRKIFEWFRANKLSLKEDKTRFTLFHRPQDRDNQPLRLPALKINDHEIKRSSSIKFLGILVDEYLILIDHINILENKLPKNLSLLYKTKPFLNDKAMKSLYFPFFHSYVTYENKAWCSTSMGKLKKVFSKQKQVIKTVTSLDHKNLKSEEIMNRLDILNIYKLNIYYTVNLIFRVNNNTISEAFRAKFQIVQYNSRQDKAKITLKNLK